MTAGASSQVKLAVFRWATVLIILQALYLVLELAFNARLVDSVIEADNDYFEHLAHIGRILSGAGCALVGFSLLRKWNTQSMRLRVGAHVLLVAVAFPVVYHGQEMMIDTLVDNSTAEQRVHAQYIALLKRGLASNAVVFKGVEFTPEELERPAAKTFINTMGFAVFFAPNYIQSVMENSDQILRHLAMRQANDDLPAAYEKYLQARDKADQLSVRYNEANAQYQEEITAVAPQAREIWHETYVELQEKWEQVRLDPKQEKLKNGLDQLYDRLDLYFTARNNCREKVCMRYANREYDAAVLSLLGKHVPPRYWCKPVPKQKGLLLDSVSFVEDRSSEQVHCSINNRDFIQAQFLKLHDVASIGYDNFEQFMASAEVSREVRERLAHQNILMPDTYRLQYQSFLNGVESELTRHLKHAFLEAAYQEFGVAIEPNLSTNDFLRHPIVQAPLKSALELENTSKPVAINLSQQAFRDEILIPQLQKSLAKERARLLAKTEFFADGEPYAEDGKIYVRSVLVPPVAMGLSLFFGLLNLVNLGAALLSQARLPAAVIATGKLVFVLVLVFGPLLASSSIAQSEPFQKIVDETQNALGVGRYYVVWLTSLQPLVYPLGVGLADALYLFEAKS